MDDVEDEESSNKCCKSSGSATVYTIKIISLFHVFSENDERIMMVIICMCFSERVLESVLHACARSK